MVGIFGFKYFINFNKFFNYLFCLAGKLLNVAKAFFFLVIENMFLVEIYFDINRNNEENQSEKAYTLIQIDSLNNRENQSKKTCICTLIQIGSLNNEENQSKKAR